MEQEYTDKASVLQAIRDKHVEMETLLGTLDEKQMTAPVLDDGWSVKDTLAHLVDWERLMIGWLNTLARGEQPVIYTPQFVDDGTDETMNRLNAQLHEQTKSRSLNDVLADFQ